MCLRSPAPGVIPLRERGVTASRDVTLTGDALNLLRVDDLFLSAE